MSVWSLPVLAGVCPCGVRLHLCRLEIRVARDADGVGVLWAAVPVHSQCGIIAPNDALIAEHWLYLPTMGLALSAACRPWRSAGRQTKIGHRRGHCVRRHGRRPRRENFAQNEIWRDPEGVLRQHFQSRRTVRPRPHQFRRVLSGPGRIPIKRPGSSRASPIRTPARFTNRRSRTSSLRWLNK